MKYTFAVSVLLGLASYEDVRAVQLKQLISIDEETECEDWDDMDSNIGVFNSQSYAQDTPSGYDSLVEEVAQKQELMEKQKHEAAV